jgi:hypothetical protein
MKKSLAVALDNQRIRDHQADCAMQDLAYKSRATHKLTVQGLSAANTAYLKLLRAISQARSIIRGESISVTIDGMPFDQWGKYYRDLRFACIRHAIETVNYWHAKAGVHVDISHTDRDVQELRLAADQILNGEGD